MSERRLDMRVNEPSHVGRARALAVEAAKRAGLSEDSVGQVALAASELASNLVKHAVDGMLLAQHAPGRLNLVTVDRGPGMRDPKRCLTDGFSTAGSMGTGMGAIRRAADFFDLYSLRDKGTAVLARWLEGGADAGAAGIVLPAPGESACGDGWRVADDGRRVTAVLIDGSGHGRAAEAAAASALRVVDESPFVRPLDMLELMRERIAQTRGAAAAVVAIDREAGVLRFAGVGNIVVKVHEPGAEHSVQLVSSPGIVGHRAQRHRPVETLREWTTETMVIMNTDGISQRWSLADWPGVRAVDPLLLGALILWQANRLRDDAGVLVLAGNGGGR
ncbi:ATP-binding protein [Allokutzneria sp. NRRL B-24872]|uniref:ATP-binding protein n=1 Tax=Allokutzneria sp. NRRL B-24872 TaxID=1137961 RepID=UPI000A3B8E15|nr:ATP-binding protein [Allokutzneria sp. NRRL B-24872]